jgi:hypothetical protein
MHIAFLLAKRSIKLGKLCQNIQWITSKPMLEDRHNDWQADIRGMRQVLRGLKWVLAAFAAAVVAAIVLAAALDARRRARI